MSEFFREKIVKLESLDEREKVILDFIMADVNVKIVDIANQIHLGESTTRNTLSGIFTKLGVPADERDKRGFVVREYSEAYRERYPKVGEIPSQPQNSPVSEPRIDVSPPSRRVSQRVVIIGIIGGFALISICSIIFLLVFLRVLNRPMPVVMASAMPQTVVEQNTPEPVYVYETATPETVVIIPSTATNVPTYTSVPPTPTYLPTPTRKDLYAQGEWTYLRENVFISLDQDFWTAWWASCINDPGFVVNFEVRNEGTSDFLMRFDKMSFSAVDNTGKSYQLTGSGSGQCEDFGIYSETVRDGGSRFFVIAFAGQILVDARYIDITINDISGSGKIVFRKNL
jgi:hypothetical protein